MATTPDSQNLELSVTDFGPIAKGKIDLRPLTVFVGPSNTGKSYLAILVYAMHKFFSQLFRRPMRRFLVEEHLSDLSEDEITNILSWMQETQSNLEIRREKFFSIELPKSIATIVHSFFLSNIRHSEDDLRNEIVRCFGVDKVEDLVRHSIDKKIRNVQTRLSLCSSLVGTRSKNLFLYNVALNKQKTNKDSSVLNTLPMQVSVDPNILSYFQRLNEIDEEGEQFAKWAVIELLTEFSKAVLSNIVAPLSRPAYYLPADRAGVMHAHQVAVRGLIASASRTALQRDSPMPVLSGVLGDFLEQLVSLTSFSSMHGESQDDSPLALHMEQLLQGTVRVERSQIDYPSFVYRPANWKRDLPLMNASSMVSELAPVVLYLRHMVQPGDLLIIEEPESHLHPAMQVEFIRQLAVAVKSGIRILITTHSEWVLEELANLVRLSELPAERRVGIDDSDVALSPDEVGAWFFERGPKNSGSVVREMPLDVESGTFSSGFGLITEGLYNRWAEISNRIEEE